MSASTGHGSSQDGGTEDPGQEVPSGTLQRGLAILDVLADGSRPDVAELMTSLDLSRSATYRILGVLRDHQLIEWDPAISSEIGLGQKAILLGMTGLAQFDPWDVGRAELKQLAADTGESALMAIIDGVEAVYVAHEDATSHTVGVRRLLGVRRPLYATSLGKAHLAALEPAEADALIEQLQFTAWTRTTLTTADQLRADLELCRARGYAIDDGEHESGVMCAGVAVRDHTGHPVCALSVAGPVERVRPQLDQLAEHVGATARSLSQRLGWIDPAAASSPRKAQP